MRKVIITAGAMNSLERAVEFYEFKLTPDKLDSLFMEVLKRIESLGSTALHGQIEPSLSSEGKGHRRLVEGHFKIIYRLEGDMVYVTDIFDSRQNPHKMKG